MVKVKLSEIAQEIARKPEEVLTKAKEMGLKVHNVTNSVDVEIAGYIAEYILTGVNKISAPKSAKSTATDKKDKIQSDKVKKTRKLEINNFKNLGIGEKTTLILPPSDSGDLLFVIGENNVGKSNLLSAIKAFGDKSFQESDKPNFVECEEATPSIKLIEKSIAFADTSSNFKNEIEECKNSIEILYVENIGKKQKIIDKKATYQALSQKFSELSEIFLEYDYDEPESAKLMRLKMFKGLNDEWQKWKYYEVEEDVEFEEYITSFYDEATTVYFNNIDWKLEYYGREYYVSENLSLLEKKIDCFDDICEANSNFVEYADKIAKLRKQVDRLSRQYRDESTIDSNPFEDKYNELKEIFFPKIDSFIVYRQGGVDISGNESLVPQVIWYEEKQVKDSDLVTTPNDFGASRFFQSLCKALGSTKVATQIQECYSKNKNDAYRENLEENINKIIKNAVTKKFNELYQWGSEYAFRLRLESARISLSFSKKNTIKEPLTLSQQSTGFQWFFSFFFNFLHSHNLNSGDIVLLDELGGSLSIPTQRDLRKFLKDFAKSKCITFIAAIHTPYMIDINHLDEIRIIEQRVASKDNAKNKEVCGTEIINDFSTIDDEIDSLAKIRQAFGVDNHFSMVGGDSKIIFVEGITDYNYLTKFKLLYEKEKDKKLDIAFVPIGGLGIHKKDKNKKLELTPKQIRILDELPKLARTHKEHYALLLVDNDNMGKAIKAHEKDNLKVISIDEPPFETQGISEIEDIFGRNDIQKFLLNDKSSERSRLFKNDDTQIEKTTKENFYTLLEFLNC